jgi:hypothetical protein
MVGCDIFPSTFDKNYNYVDNQPISSSENILIIDNDVYDPDYIPLVLNSIHENSIGNVNIGLMIVSDIGVSNKTNMLYRSILDEFNSDIPLAITHKHEGITFKSRLTNNLENYTDIISDPDTEDAIIALQNKLEAQDDKTVSYAIGGKLKFLKDFISDPYRLELFTMKVKDITFGLGCNPRDKQCSRDHNLASTPEALSATKTVYSKLHGKIPFIVVDDKRGRVRSLDIFKNANIPLMNHLLGTNIYGTYGDHHAGDVEILFSHSRKEHFIAQKCNVVFSKESFKAQNLGSGSDLLLINKDLDINGLTYQIYSSLIKNK